MVDLLSAIGDFFSGAKKQIFETNVNFAVSQLSTIHGHDTLASAWAATDPALKVDERVKAAYNDAVKRTAGEKDLGVFGAIPEALMNGFNALEPQVEKAVCDALNPIFNTHATTVIGLFSDVSGGVVRSVVCAGLNTNDPKHKALSDDIVAKVEPIIIAGVTFAVASLLADQLHPVKNPGLQTMMRSLQDVVGYQSLSSAYSDPIRKATIGVPIEHSINRIVQPYHPGIGIVENLVRQRQLTFDRFGDIARDYGYMEPYIAAMENAVWTQPGLRNLLIISQYARPDPAPDAEGRTFLQAAGLSQYINSDWYNAEKLAKSGFSSRDIPYLLQSIKARTINSVVANVYAVKKSQYAAGRIDRTEYETFLTSKGFSAGEVKEALDAIQDDLSATDKQQLAALYEKKFLNGRMTEADLRASLASLDKTAAYIDTRVKLLTEQKLGKLTAVEDSKILSRADYQKQYADGLISRTQFINALDVFGYSLPDATEIADLVDRDALDDVRTETIRAAEEKTKNKRMSLPDLESVYVANGKTQVWAAARRSYIEQTILGKLEVVIAAVPDDQTLAVQSENIRAAEEEAKHGRITISALTAVYVANGKTQAWAAARAAYIGETIETETLAATAAEKAAAEKAAAAEKLSVAAKAAAEKVAEVEAVEAENVRTAEQSAKDLRLTKDQLIAAYVKNGKSRDWSNARAAYIAELISGKATTTKSV